MKSNYAVVAMVVFLAGIAALVWYLMRADRLAAGPPFHGVAANGRGETQAVPKTSAKPQATSPASRPVRQSVTSSLEAEVLAADSDETTPAEDVGNVEVLVTEADEMGLPVEGASVHLGPETPDTVRGHTDASGRVVLTQLPVGAAELTVACQEYVSKRVFLVVRSRETVQVPVALDPCGSIEGIVVKAGSPLAGQLVACGDGLELRATTDDHGRYAIPNVPVGGTRVELSGQGNHRPYLTAEWAQATAVVEKGKTTELNFDVPVTDSAIEGTVLIDGRPPATGEVSLRIECSHGKYFDKVEVGADGRYRIENLPAGSVALMARATPAGGPERRQTLEFDLNDGEVLPADFTFEAPGIVHGTVRDIKNAETTVFALTGKSGQLDNLTLQDLQDLLNRHFIAASSGVSPDGTYRLEGLNPGAYTVVALAFPKGVPGEDIVDASIHAATQVIQLNAGTDRTVNLRIP